LANTFFAETFTAPSNSSQTSDEPTTYIDTEASEIKMACMVQTLCSDVFGIGGWEPSNSTDEKSRSADTKVGVREFAEIGLEGSFRCGDPLP